jgi:hypothetical protein
LRTQRQFRTTLALQRRQQQLVQIGTVHRRIRRAITLQGAAAERQNAQFAA